MLSLGIPANVATALLLGAFVILGVQPSPTLINTHPDLFWGTVASMYVGNVMLLVLNLPLIGLWVQILRIPYSMLFPGVLLFGLIGVYMVNTSIAEVWIMIMFGLIGYVMKKTDYEFAPMVLAMVIAPIFENAFRQSLILSGGSFSIFVTPTPGCIPGRLRRNRARSAAHSADPTGHRHSWRSSRAPEWAIWQSHDLPHAQVSDQRGVVAELREHILGMLATLRRRCSYARRRALHFGRLPCEADLA